MLDTDWVFVGTQTQQDQHYVRLQEILPKEKHVQSLAFKKIDAFTGAASSGNPAGAIYLKAPQQLSPEQMQRIAFECRGWVSEVGFVASLDCSSFWMRYFSSEKEVAFCGHATLAIAYDLLTSSASLCCLPEIEIRTKDSTLRAFNNTADEDAVYISAPQATYRECRVRQKACAEALRIGRGIGAEPRAVINAGLETLIVEVESLKATVSLKPDMDELKAFCVQHDIDIVLTYTSEVATKGCAYRTRVFAPRFGYLEDPATGSGNSAFGYHLLQSRKWSDGILTLEQNGSVQNPNLVKLSLGKDKDGEAMVRFGGRATVKVKGEYYIEGQPNIGIDATPNVVTSPPH